MLNYALGLLGGLLVGFILVLLVESLDDTLSSSEELELSTGLPVLCSVPVDHLTAPSKILQGANETEKALLPSAPLLLNHPRSHAAEAFRGLRTALLLSSWREEMPYDVVSKSGSQTNDSSER
jgi:hypothetical protein